jgi:hypothetical protein
MNDTAPLAALLRQVSELSREVGALSQKLDSRDQLLLHEKGVIIQRLDSIDERLNRGDQKFDALQAAKATEKLATAEATGEKRGIRTVLAILGTLTMTALTTIGGLVYQYWGDIVTLVKTFLYGRS